MEELVGKLSADEVKVEGSTYIAEELVGIFSVAVVNVEGGTPSIKFLEEKVAETLQYRNEAIPSVTEDGVLSWSNKAGIDNPSSVNIKGEKGEDGYSPQKGVDYYTEADRQDIIEDVLARFPSYEGEYTVSPSRQAKTLETANKVLSDNITISEISYSEVSNNSGGTTYYIAKE